MAIPIIDGYGISKCAPDFDFRIKESDRGSPGIDHKNFIMSKKYGGATINSNKYMKGLYNSGGP